MNRVIARRLLDVDVSERIAVVEDVFVEAVGNGVRGDRRPRQDEILPERRALAREVVDQPLTVGGEILAPVPVAEQRDPVELGAAAPTVVITAADSGAPAAIGIPMPVENGSASSAAARPDVPGRPWSCRLCAIMRP